VATTGSSKSPKSAKPDKKATAPAKKAAPVKKPAAKKAAPVKKAATKKASPASKSTPAKKTAASGSATPAKKETATSAASRIEIRIPVERQKAAQAAGNFELDELPGELAQPAAAIRIGKGASTDKPLKLVRTIEGISKMRPGQVIANYGKSEAKWALDFNRRRAGRATFMQLLSYSRQVIGIDSQGRIRICLMGHAGQGLSTALWVLRDDVVLTVQPNDIILRFEGLEIEE
jgi:hypothetical protein